VRCSALQCVAVCCSALQCVAVCCKVIGKPTPGQCQEQTNLTKIVYSKDILLPWGVQAYTMCMTYITYIKYMYIILYRNILYMSFISYTCNHHLFTCHLQVCRNPRLGSSKNRHTRSAAQFVGPPNQVDLLSRRTHAMLMTGGRGVIT